MNQDLEKNTANVDDKMQAKAQVPEQVDDLISDEEVTAEHSVHNVTPQNDTVNLEKPRKKKKWFLFGCIAGVAALIAVICYFLLFSMPTMKDVDKAFKDGNPKKALKMLGKMTEEGDTAAFTRLYEYYLKHDDPEEAWKWLYVAANKDIPSAMYKLGMQYWEKEKNDSAKYWLNKAAKLEIPQYMFDFADFCRQNNDTPTYLKWMEKAAASDDKAIVAKANTKLGMHYFLIPDAKKAFPYLEKAAKMDDGDAQWALGRLYYKDNNIEKFLYWSNKALDNNTAEKITRENTYKQLLQYYNQIDDSEGKENLIKKAVNYDIPDATRELMVLSMSYFLGNNGVSKDMNKAAQLMKIAAQKDVPEAQYLYGRMIVDDDLEEGYRWLEKAARQGHSEAIEHLKEWSEVYYSDVQGKIWRNTLDETGVRRTVQFMSGGIVKQRWTRAGAPDSEIVFKIKKTRYQGNDFFVIDDILSYSGDYDPRTYIGQPFTMERTIGAKINILTTADLKYYLEGTYEKEN